MDGISYTVWSLLFVVRDWIWISIVETKIFVASRGIASRVNFVKFIDSISCWIILYSKIRYLSTTSIRLRVGIQFLAKIWRVCSSTDVRKRYSNLFLFYCLLFSYTILSPSIINNALSCRYAACSIYFKTVRAYTQNVYTQHKVSLITNSNRAFHCRSRWMSVSRSWMNLKTPIIQLLLTYSRSTFNILRYLTKLYFDL